jgi:hypothetical protein
MSSVDKVLLWFVKIDDRLRDNQAIKLGVGIPIAVMTYVLGLNGLWVVVAVVMLMTFLPLLLTVWGRRRLNMPAPKKRR